MAERVVRVKLSAQVADYEKAMMEAARSTRAVGTEAEKLAQKKEAFQQLGGAAFGVGAALTAMTGLAVKAAIDWESAWAGVTKTVDGTPEQLQAVEDGLRGLTAVLPATHDEIAGVAEAAGQLGIRTENVVAFTKTMIDLGETTNLSANDAATALARFTNIMGTSQEQVSNLGSALVGLGNNYATTESEILDMSMRLAGAGKQIGLTEGDVLGLATALSSVGIEAEAGGSAVSKVMIDIAASVEEGGDRLEMFAKTAGMSADQFAQKWRTAPSEALSAFVKGLANAEAQGTSALGVLQELGITEVRMRDALLRSASAADMFSGAMAKGNDEFTDNLALLKEAAKRYETTESQMKIAGNAVREAAIDVGEVFLPAVKTASQIVTGLAQAFGDLPDPVKGLVGLLGGVAGAVGLVGGAALLAAPKVVEFKIAMETLGWSVGRMAWIGGGATIAITALFTAVGSLAAAHGEARQRADRYADALRNGADAAELMIENLLKVDTGVLGLQDFGSAADAVETLGLAFDTVTSAIEGSPKAIAEVDKAIQSAKDSFNQWTGEGKEAYNAATLLEDAIRQESEALAEGKRLTDLASRATEENAESTQTAADAYMGAADEVQELSSQLLKLIDTVNAANGVGQDAVTANARYQESLAEIAKQAADMGTSLDQSTVAGSANAAMLAGVAEDAQRAAEAQLAVDQQTMSAKDASEKYAATLAEQRQKFEEAATAAGFNADQVKALGDQIFRLPSEKEIQVIAETARAQDSVEDFIRRNADRRFNIYIDAINSGGGGGGRGALSNADGGLYGYEAFANGGFSSGIYKGRPGGIHKFAEPETGWEAYISGKPDARNRNIGIWMEAGRRLGVEATAQTPAVVLEGAEITGTLNIGGDGLVRIIDGRIVSANQASARVVRGRASSI